MPIQTKTQFGPSNTTKKNIARPVETKNKTFVKGLRISLKIVLLLRFKMVVALQFLGEE